jgi:peptidoglycan L-alanyl-D-glutamate endopeptidase CwlK
MLISLFKSGSLALLLSGIIALFGDWGQVSHADLVLQRHPGSDSLCPLERLVLAYPEHLAGFEENVLIWKDSTRMIFDDSIPVKDWYTLNNFPDLEDQFRFPYMRGMEFDTPSFRFSPGTIRYEPFFKKMYGGDKDAVEKNLASVVWLPNTAQKNLKVTTVNDLHLRVQAISDELEARPALRKFFDNPAGVYNWRVIKGTTQLSMHSFGIAFDINAKQAHFWRWEDYPNDSNLVYKNKIPLEIVEVFEKYGFIWGGKWYRYDTMHFEYRPEFLL